MAKRGYRGAHPYNDMKVASNENAAANNGKLTDEYNKTTAKYKYDYIKSHDGFNPQGTSTITINAGPSADETLVIVSTDGTSKTYTAHTTVESCPQFLTTDPSGSLATCINSASAGHGGKITAVASVGQIVLTQVEPGPDGNTTMTNGLSNMTAGSFTGG